MRIHQHIIYRISLAGLANFKHSTLRINKVDAIKDLPVLNHVVEQPLSQTLLWTLISQSCNYCVSASGASTNNRVIPTSTVSIT